MINLIRYSLLSAIIFLFIACGGGGGGSSSGTLSISLTDAPVDSAEAVVIFVTGATIQAGDGTRTTVAVNDPLTNKPGRSIDLLKLTGSKSVLLFTDVMTAQDYSWIRLDVDLSPQKSYIQIAGNQYALTCNSCLQNGIKVNRSFTVSADATQAFVLDFDLRKSITDPQSNNTYKLRPTIRMVAANAAGNISGSVDGTLISQLGGVTGCSVYVYQGQVTPDDIYLPDTGSVPTTHINPVTVANVSLDTTTMTYSYDAAYLPAGTYTVSLTCEAENDNTPLDDVIAFTQTRVVTVTAGSSTTVNYTVPVTVP